MSVTEAALQQGGNDKAGPLIAAIGLISGEQQYTFELYRRVVLPIDGFVFWVKATTINPAWLGQYGQGTFNSVAYDGNAATPPALTPIELAKYSFQVNASVQRDAIVAGTLCSSVVARMKTTCAGGSSIVLSRALNAAVDSMCVSSMMKIL